MKKFLKHIVYGLLVFVALNLLILVIYEYPAYKAIKNKTHKNYLKWNDIHSNPQSYDLIVLGSSRSYTAFNPEIIDSSLNIKSYNMGTSAQDIAESYYSLKEILDYQTPKYVVLDLFLPSGDNAHDFYQIFSNASFFNSSKHKYNLVVDGYGEKGITNYLIPLLKFNGYIKQDIGALFKKNNKINHGEIWIDGFLNDTSVVSKGQIKNFKPISNYTNTTFNKERFVKYFNKIKALASANNITLICTRAPYPPSRLALSDNTDEGDFYSLFTADNGILFYDLNSFKNDTYRYKDQDFSDYHHTNYLGAEKASKQLVDAIKEDANPSIIQ